MMERAIWNYADDWRECIWDSFTSLEGWWGGRDGVCGGGGVGEK